MFKWINFRNLNYNLTNLYDWQAISHSTMTLGRGSSFRNRPMSASGGVATDHGPKTKITSGLMNWTRPFRKSRDESEKVITKSMTRKDADSLSPRSSHPSLMASRQASPAVLRNQTATSRVGPSLASNLRNLGASNVSLKRSTSSVSSLKPIRVSLRSKFVHATVGNGLQRLATVLNEHQTILPF